MTTVSIFIIEPIMKLCYQISAYGRVQGVGFRKTAATMARKLGLVGFAENRADGSVLMEVEGEQPETSEFISWCQSGPLHQLIEEFEYQEVPLRSYESFEIKT